MAARYKEYLAMNVLNEGQIVCSPWASLPKVCLANRTQVSYRALSRALKVHVNAAKELVYADCSRMGC